MAGSEIVAIERTLKALANRRRIAIIRLLKSRKEASVGDVAEAIKLSLKATSKHIGVLSAAGLLDREQRSLQMFYRIADELPKATRTLISLL